MGSLSSLLGKNIKFERGGGNIKDVGKNIAWTILGRKSRFKNGKWEEYQFVGNYMHPCNMNSLQYNSSYYYIFCFLVIKKIEIFSFWMFLSRPFGLKNAFIMCPDTFGNNSTCLNHLEVLPGGRANWQSNKLTRGSSR